MKSVVNYQQSLLVCAVKLVFSRDKEGQSFQFWDLSGITTKTKMLSKIPIKSDYLPACYNDYENQKHHQVTMPKILYFQGMRD